MWLIPLFLILLLPACAQKIENNNVIDFADSVKIVRELLQSNSLAHILENPEPDQLDFLINNFSPAEIAFESEVLNCTETVILYCHQNRYDQNIVDTLQQKCPHQKIVIIDADLFPFLVLDMEIDKSPTVTIVQGRAKIARFVGLQAILNQSQTEA